MEVKTWVMPEESIKVMILYPISQSGLHAYYFKTRILILIAYTIYNKQHSKQEEVQY